MQKFLIGSFMFFSLAACSTDAYQEKALSEKELILYLNDEENGLKKRNEIKDGYVEVVYKPTDLIIAQNYKDKFLDAGEIDSQVQAYSNSLYFVLRISKNGKEIETANRVVNKSAIELEQYLAYDMPNDIYMKVGNNKDPIFPSDFQYIKMFGYSEATSFLLVFDRGILEQNKTIEIIFDGSHLEIGVQHFKIHINDIKEIPALKL